jgi:pilus assembly protein Flp/PilA
MLNNTFARMDISLRKGNAAVLAWGGRSLSSPAYRVSAQEQVMNRVLKQFLLDQSGATAIEYGLIAAGISVAIIAVVNSLGSQLKTTFSTVSSQLATAGK